jgi:hypothetical protein
MLGETLEPRSMLAVSASVSSGTLNIVLGAGGDAAFLSYTGSAYTLTNGVGATVSGSPFSGVTGGVNVTGTVAVNQSFTFSGSTSLPVSLTVANSIESATISQAINAAGLSGSTVSLSSAAITLAADISTEGSQAYGGAVLLVGSPSLTSTAATVSFQSTVDAYFGVGLTAQATFATGTSPVSVSIGDLNGDGKPDLALANADSATNLHWLINNAGLAPGAGAVAGETGSASAQSPSDDFNSIKINLNLD